ncbi:unnamed protein product [Peronospora destructor]|uniref:Ubiquitin-like domain-containing protein n=1 Tax=Peronospora destructor TaxID=86335 RepID=A0AAV0TNW1_9STRA|nr:unnamed protein product [Peronospora destructor]
MSVLTLPLPWMDINEVGLKGVIEVHSSDLRRQKVKGSRVCELMAILNEKLKALPQQDDDRLLESLILDLESSTPRLVVAVQARPKTTKNKGLVVFVKTLTGKSVTVVCTSDDTVDCVKSQIRVQAHVPVDDQRISNGERIIHRMGFDYFNLMKESDVQCPECNTEVKPITCGFYNCAWKFEGIKTGDSFSISSRWKEVEDENKYHRFDERCNSMKWSSLLFVAKPLQESTAANLNIPTFFTGNKTCMLPSCPTCCCTWC